jgi:hypothetical protein
MLPRLLWLAVGGVAALLAVVRVQLLVLERYPETAWLATAAGLGAGGALLALVLIMGLGLRSLRKTGWLLVLTPLLFLGAGYYGITRYPAQHFADEELSAQWERLHPALRLAAWMAAVQDQNLLIAQIAPQSSGPADAYSPAVELRVTQAGPIRRWVRQGLFLLMGLEVTSQGDHLHLTLPGVQNFFWPR